MKVLTIATTYPDKFHPTIAPWSKKQVDSIKLYTNIEVEVIAPRPITLPFKFFPFYKFSKLPLKEISDLNFTIHHPRFPYLVPKMMFFNMTGDLFSFFISNYMLEHVNKPDIVHARFAYLDGYGVLKACKKWHINLLFDSHGVGDFGQLCTSRLRMKKFKQTIEYSSQILCVAQWQIQEAIRFGISKEKLQYVPLGVDIEKFKPRNKDKIREEFHIKEQKIVLFVGQLTEKKGVHHLLKAIQILSENNCIKDTRFILIGDGPQKEEFLDLSLELKIHDSTTFMGPVYGKTLLKWYSVADLFVLPSLVEGKPTVINEAMASQCAIIATNVGGIAEQVIDGYNG
ncbi:MAG: glycosyltransferase family 4 protein, partial [Candidatus Thermoplasmatota archaeon]|nr:glycosyltransferase family 4 protein [Candidatus Thermoplasmatota archaeon]